MAALQYSVQPASMPVDEQTEVEITAVLDRRVDAGGSIAFALPVVWYCQRYCVTFTKKPQFTDPHAPDYVSVTSPDARFALSLTSILLPSGRAKGHIQKIVATVEQGTLRAGSVVRVGLHNFRAPWLAEQGEVRVWINDEELTDTPRLTTLPARARRLRVIVPSARKPGEAFHVRIVSLDPFWNRSCSVFRNGVLRFADGEVVERDIGFTGSYATRVAIDRPGVHRLHFCADPCEDTLIADDALSNPIRITDAPCGPFWGDVHSHDKMHNCGAGEDPFTYAREVSGLDFVCVAPDFKAFSQEVWQAHMDRTNAANDPERFTAILSYEVGFKTGHHNVYCRGSAGRMADTSDPSLWHVDKWVEPLDEKENFVVPHHVAIDWGPHERYYPERDKWIPLVELYSNHGLSEMYAPEHILAYEFNRTRGKAQKYAASEERRVYVRDAWAQGRRYGVIAGSDDHMGQPGKPVKGCTGVWAQANTREALFDNLRARHCYATTGERILVDFRINGAPMGSELIAQPGETLTFVIEIHGTDEIAFVELAGLKLGEDAWERVFYDRLHETDPFHERGAAARYDYEKTLEKTFEADAVYYLRMAQRKTIDDYPVFAWTSPIWVTASRWRGSGEAAAWRTNEGSCPWSWCARAWRASRGTRSRPT